MVMATILEDVKKQYIPRSNDFYRNHYHHVIIGLMIVIVLMTIAVGVVLYQMFHRPLPVFSAAQPSGEKMLLISFDEPNLLPDTILRWASKAATAAYTFDFVNYNKQISAARPYFTEAGWQSYLQGINGVIDTARKGQLFINGIVAGTAVISNQGPLPGKGYVWRIQIPFLVTYQTANGLTKRNYLVVLTIMRVPTQVNPQGIGIDQFVMVQR
jgi:intracellular multiplication protein IcmL